MQKKRLFISATLGPPLLFSLHIALSLSCQRITKSASDTSYTTDTGSCAFRTTTISNRKPSSAPRRAAQCQPALQIRLTGEWDEASGLRVKITALNSLRAVLICAVWRHKLNEAHVEQHYIWLKGTRILSYCSSWGGKKKKQQRAEITVSKQTMCIKLFQIRTENVLQVVLKTSTVCIRPGWGWIAFRELFLFHSLPLTTKVPDLMVYLEHRLLRSHVNGTATTLIQ